jgi:hypothetical protein
MCKYMNKQNAGNFSLTTHILYLMTHVFCLISLSLRICSCGFVIRTQTATEYGLQFHTGNLSLANSLLVRFAIRTPQAIPLLYITSSKSNQTASRIK